MADSIEKRFEDLANQIKFSAEYNALLKASGRKAGRYLSVAAAEWFQGLVELNCFAIVSKLILQDYLQAGHRQDQMPLIWMHSGSVGLLR